MWNYSGICKKDVITIEKSEVHAVLVTRKNKKTTILGMFLRKKHLENISQKMLGSVDYKGI